MAVPIRHRNLPERVYSSHFTDHRQNSPDEKSQELLQFPKSTCVLWDGTSTGPPVFLHVAQNRKPRLELSEKVLWLTHRQLDSDSCSRVLVGSLSVDEDGDGVCFHIDGLDTRQAGADSSLVLGDVMIPVQVSSSRNQDRTGTVEDYAGAIKMLQKRCCGREAVDLSSLLLVKGWCSFYANQSSDKVVTHLQFDIVTLATVFKATPVNAVPIVPTALAKNLGGPRSLSHMQGRPKVGYLTMDHTRKLLLVLESDPKVASLPIVGIWVSGVPSVSHPFVWAGCLRYLQGEQLQDRVCLPPEGFLLLLYSHLHSRPEFYEVVTTTGKPGLDFDLYTGYEITSLNKKSSGPESSVVEWETSPVRNGPKREQFDAALEGAKTLGQPEAPVSSAPPSSVVNDDIVPRMLPAPHQAKTMVVQHLVPEVSMLWNDPVSSGQPSFSSGPSSSSPHPSSLNTAFTATPAASFATAPSLQPRHHLAAGPPLSQVGGLTASSMAQGSTLGGGCLSSGGGQPGGECMPRSGVPTQHRQQWAGPGTPHPGARATPPQPGLSTAAHLPWGPQPSASQSNQLYLSHRAPSVTQWQALVSHQGQAPNQPAPPQPRLMPPTAIHYCPPGQAGVATLHPPSLPHPPPSSAAILQQQARPVQQAPCGGVQRGAPPHPHPQCLLASQPQLSYRPPASNPPTHPQTHCVLSLTANGPNQLPGSSGVVPGHLYPGMASNGQQGQFLGQSDPRFQQTVQLPHMQEAYRLQAKPQLSQGQHVHSQAHGQQQQGQGQHIHYQGQGQQQQSQGQYAHSQGQQQQGQGQHIHSQGQGQQQQGQHAHSQGQQQQGQGQNAHSQGQGQQQQGQSQATLLYGSMEGSGPWQQSGPTVPTPTLPPNSLGSIPAPPQADSTTCSGKSSDDSGLSVTPDRSDPSPKTSGDPLACCGGLEGALGGVEVNWAGVPSQVVQLLIQQDAQLKVLQTQIQHLLSQQEGAGSPAPDTPTQPRAEEATPTPASTGSTPATLKRETRSTAVNTTLVDPNPQSTWGRAQDPQPARCMSIQTSPPRAVSSQLSAPWSPAPVASTHLFPPSQAGAGTQSPGHQGESSSQGQTPADIRHQGAVQLSSTQRHEEPRDSTQSSLSLEQPSPVRSMASPGEVSGCSPSPQSASMCQTQQDEGDTTEGISPYSKEYYDQLINNIRLFLDSHSQDGEESSVPRSDTAVTDSQDYTALKVMDSTLNACPTTPLGHRSEGGSSNTTLLPTINYLSMMLGSETDASLEINAMAMKYLRDEQLTQMARLRQSSPATGSGTNHQLLRQVLAASLDVTGQSDSATNLSLASRRYLQRYGLSGGGGEGSVVLDSNQTLRLQTDFSLAVMSESGSASTHPGVPSSPQKAANSPYPPSASRRSPVKKEKVQPPFQPSPAIVEERDGSYGEDSRRRRMEDIDLGASPALRPPQPRHFPHRDPSPDDSPIFPERYRGSRDQDLINDCSAVTEDDPILDIEKLKQMPKLL